MTYAFVHVLRCAFDVGRVRVVIRPEAYWEADHVEASGLDPLHVVQGDPLGPMLLQYRAGLFWPPSGESELIDNAGTCEIFEDGRADLNMR